MKEKGTSMNELKKAIIKANKHYNLIEKDDKIAVGFSGGVDSFALVEGLHILKQIVPFSFDFDLFYMDMKFDDMDITQAMIWCQKKGYPLHIIDTDIANILKLHPQNNNKYSCSICSRLKKGIMIQHCKALNYNKVAFAHHGDDAIETLFLNMVYGAKLATFQPRMLLSNQNMVFVRPLVYVYKDLIENYQQQYKWPVVASTCPNNNNTQRSEMKKLIAQIIHHHPSAKANLLKSLYNNEQVDLWKPQHHLK